MTWRNEWSAIASRIDSLLSAGHFLIQALGINSSDSYKIADKHLGKEAQQIVSSLRRFLEAHCDAIPPAAAAVLKEFLDNYGKAIEDQSVKGLDGLKLRVTSLAAARSAVEYHLSDFQALAHKRAERAFLHLRQTIAVDDAVKERWRAAFSKGELACEKLGAAHLMLHGIWAFKVNAEGGRTDLVFGNPVDQTEQIAGVAEALVLTEWKIVRTRDKPEAVANVARKQAQQYAGGVLAGIELSRYRYIVLVSAEQLPVMKDIEDDSVMYRHINVPVQPKAPSKAARKKNTA